jgi:hypothetical protein
MAKRVRTASSGRQTTCLDQLRRHRMILCQLAQVPVVEEIGPAVPDMGTVSLPHHGV